MNQNEQLDPSIVALTRAIGQQESGGKYDKYGDAGTSLGAYQWNNGKVALKQGEIPANFKSFASEVGVDPNDFSPANQDRVAYKTIEKWGKEGLKPSQIAAKWNSGLSEGWENHKGDVVINGKNVHYDTPAYVNAVAKFYQQNLGSNSSPQSNKNSFVTEAKISQPEQIDIPQEENKTTLAGDIIRSVAKPLAKTATSGINIAQTIAGKDPTKPFSGNYLGNVGPVGEGFNISKGLKENKESLVDSVRTGGELGAIAEGGGLLKNLLSKTFSKGGALTSKALREMIPMEVSEFNALTARKKLQVIEQALKHPHIDTEAKIFLKKAREELEPLVAKELGLLPSVIRKGVSNFSSTANGLFKNIIRGGIGAVGGAAVYDKLINK